MASQFRWRSAAPRIQLFVSDLTATGVVRNAIAIANEAAASGYEVRLLTCRPDGVLRNQIRPDVTVVRLVRSAEKGRSRRFQLKQALLEYRRHCREWRPDIMFSAGNHGHLLSTFAWFGLPGTKLLRISNDLDHGDPSPVVSWWRSLKFRLISNLADRLVFVSRALGDHPLLGLHLASGKAAVIPNGVDVEGVCAASHQPCTHRWAADRSLPFVLAVGRHVKQKNLGTLLRAFAIARKSRPMRLIILGDGNMDETARLSALSLDLGIADDVDLVPATANPFPLMAAAGTLALPSLWEGSSNVLLEAMACGTPVVASRTAGDAEHVLDGGKYGLLVDPHEIDGLAAALVRQTGPDRVQPGDRVNAFSRDKTMARYVAMFDELVASAARHAPIERLA
ncbi:glycosyltransferase [Sphingomonas sp. NSE70-1]|uniref:Glycosyltransferase n=1 Tax=Sphingomonas caseinilyticus TaxID=2908205 RepID=A0ABT0RX51_9SPHN|nr:glycosyltransferase [Sphingomonas caseinilyticus]MCL6699603.1 glycosyltransferase [Sphingomonas caseinilyticus]